MSEPASDIAATPYLIDDATKVAARLSPLIGVPEDQLLRKLASRTTFVYLARGVPAAKTDRAAKLKIEGIEFIPRYTREYPRDWSAAQLLGSTGTDEQGLGGLEYMLDKQLRGTDGERRLVKDAMGRPIEMRDTKPVESGEGIRLTLDANLQDRAEEVLNEVGSTWKPKGATAIVMDPNSGAVLALANWPRVNANALEKAPDYARTEPRDRCHLRARLNVQGDDRGGRARGRQGQAGHEVRRPARARRRRPPAPRLARPRLPDHDHEPDPRGLLEHRRRADLAPDRDQAVRRLDPQVGLRQADRRRPAGRGARDRAAAQGLLRLDDGQPADRPGHRRDADADGHGLRGDRQRRHPAPAAHRVLASAVARPSRRRAGA